MENTEEEKNGLSAKSTSLASMVIAGVWIAGLTIAKGFGLINLDVSHEIIPTGICLAGVFCPVYFSIIMDKLKDILSK